MNIEQLRSAIEKALRERDSTVRVALTPVAGFVQASADTRMNGVSGGSVMDEDPERALRNLTRIHGLRVTDTGEVFDPAEAYDELRASAQREIHTLTDRLAERDAELVGMREGYAKLRETLATSERERRETQEQCDGLMSSIERIAWERDEARDALQVETQRLESLWAAVREYFAAYEAVSEVGWRDGEEYARYGRALRALTTEAPR